MEQLWIPVVLVILVVVNVWLMKVDITFWKNLFTEKDKRHKKVNTDR